MKKSYVAPELATEVYELSASIAVECEITVHFGPATETQGACSDYKDPFDFKVQSVQSEPFNEKQCDCYYSAPNGYFTS